jgi:O-antigen/teichoic acid export membrane protein
MNIRNFADIKHLLFSNKTVKQTIFKNTFWLAVAEGISRLLKLVLLIYVARILGATEYGEFTFALAFVSLFVIFSDLGLSKIITREFSRDKNHEKEYSFIFSLKILLSIGTLILILIGSFFITTDSAIRSVIWILAVYILINSFSEITFAFLRARQQMQYEAAAKIIQALLITVVGIFIVLNFPSVKNLSFGYLFADFIALAFILLFFHSKIHRLQFGWNKVVWQRFLKMSWPLALVALFALIHGHIDSIMMGSFGQITEVGWYNAAHKMMESILIPSTLFFQSFYPVMSVAFKESKEKLQKIWDYRIGIVFLIAAPLVTGGLILASQIIYFIYDLSFSPSILVFQILIINAGVIYLIGPLSQILIVSDRQKINFWITGCGAVMNVILNLFLIPKYSLYGAAAATLITMIFTFIFYAICVIKLTSIKPLNLKTFLFFLIAILSSTIMYFVVSRLSAYNINILSIVFIGALIYLISVFLFNKIFRLRLIQL